MSDLMTDEEQIIWFLREFENAEDAQLEFCELEIYGEDDQGREGTCTISVQEIAKKAADFIERMVAEREDVMSKAFKMGFFQAKQVYKCELGHCATDLEEMVQDYIDREVSYDILARN